MNPISVIDNFFAKIGKVPFIFFLFFIGIYFWINGPAHFPDWDSTYGSIIVVYLVMFVVFFIFSMNKLKIPMNIAIYQFVFGFIVSFIALTIFVKSGFIEAGILAESLIWPTIIMQFCVVAPAEEFMFRGVIQSYTGVLVQAGLFALWHSYAYGVIWYNFGAEAGLASIAVAFAMGLILGYLRRLPSFDLPGVIAMHAVYNCILLGALAL